MASHARQVLLADYRTRLGAAELLMSPQYYSVRVRPMGAREHLLLFVRPTDTAGLSSDKTRQGTSPDVWSFLDARSAYDRACFGLDPHIVGGP